MQKINMSELKVYEIKKKSSAVLVVILRTLFFIGMSYILLNPILIMLSRSFRSSQDMLNPTVIWIPQNFTIDNFKVAIEITDFWNTAWLTGRIAIISTICTLVITAVTGYALARYKLKISKILIAFVVLTIVIPPQTYLIPIFFQFNNFDYFGVGSLIGLFTGTPITANLTMSESSYYLLSIMGLGIRSGLFILIFFQFFKQMPKELENAARIDGCGEIKTFVRVMLPNATSPFIVISMLSFIWYWNDTFYSNILMRNQMMLANKVANIQELIRLSFSGQARGDGATETVIIFAAALLFIIPPLIIYLFAQRFFMESVERTGIVG